MVAESRPSPDLPNSATSDDLHELPKDAVPRVCDRLALLTPDTLTNSVICDVWKELSKKGKKTGKATTWKDVSAALCQIYGTEYAETTVRSSFKAVNTRRLKLGKSTRDKAELASFLTEIYVPPQKVGKVKLNFSQSEESLNKIAKLDDFIIEAENKAVRDICKENTDLRGIIESQEKEIADLNIELEEFKQKNATLELTLETTKTKLKNLYRVVGKVGKPKCVVQSMKRKNIRIHHWRSQAVSWRKQAKKVQTLQSKCKAQGETVKTLKTQKANRKSYAKKKPKSASKQNMNTNLTDTLHSTVNILRERNSEIASLQNELCTKDDELEEMRRKKIAVRTGSKINPSVKEASMYLQGIGVAEKNVGPAINAVVTTLTDSTLNGPLPSNSTQQRISGEMRAVAKHHLREVMKNKKDITVKYDGTTKKGRHIVEVELATQEGTYMAGGMETAGGTAKDYVDCITTVLNEVDTDILVNVTNTMTDRCVVNAAVDREIENLKGSKVNSFRCSMHPLDTIHKQCEKFIKAHEHTLEMNDEDKMPYQMRGESKSQALLRAMDKLFHDSGSGLPKEIPHYIKSKGFKGGENATLYPRWVGNRFNIFFVNAGLTYSYEEHIQEFFSKVMSPRNNLHLAIKNALADGKLMPSLRALGLLDKYLTGPWMRWQGEHHQILDTCDVFTSVLNVLDGVNGKDLVCGFQQTAFGTEPKKDDKYVALTTSTADDEETASVFNGLLHEVEDVMRRQLADYLPGGKFHSPSEELKKQAQSCQSNNISGERVFAKLDAKQNQAQSAKLSKTVSKTQFSLNKCQDFLSSKSTEEKAEIIRQATKEAAKDRLKDKKLEENLQEATRKRLDQSRQQIQDREQHKRDEKEKIFESVINNGLWESEKDMQRGLRDLNKTKTLEALKAQIRLRSDVLGCKLPRKIVYSKATVEEIQTYLLELIQVPIPDNQETIINIIKDHSAIVGFQFNQKWSCDGKDTMCHGSITDIVHNKDIEYKCVFGDQDECFQTVAEILADIAVGDLFLYV